MKYIIRILALMLVFLPLRAEQAELGYQEQLEAAIVQTNAQKVTRLLKRRNRISVKNFNHMLGWANDTIEERRMLEPTPKEASAVIASSIVALCAGIAGTCYYFDVGTFKEEVKDMIFAGEKGFFSFLGLTGLASSFGFYKGWSGPRNRLAKSYEILFALEDVVDAMEKKKKAHALIAMKRSLRSKRIQ